MQYEFRQALRFTVGPEKEEFSFQCGNHEVPEKLESHPYFLKCVKAGLILDAPSKKKVETQDDVKERAERILKKLDEKAAKKAEKEALEKPIEEPKAEVKEEKSKKSR